MIFISIWPIFALIVAGYFAARRGFPSDSFWPAAERLNYFVLFPALLVSSLAKAPVGDPALLRFGGGAAVTLLLGAASLVLLRLVVPMPSARFGPVLQGVLRFNTYMALSVLTVLSGQAAMDRAAVFLAIAVPMVNVMSVLALTPAGGGSATAILRSIIRNPLIVACIAGFALALTGIGLPYGSGDLMRLTGQASLPLGLLCVGAALQPKALRGDMVGLVWTSALRLAAMPLLAAGVAQAMGLSGIEAQVLVIFSAVPTAPTAYVLTRQMNGDGPFMAGIVTIQTIIVAVTLPVVIALLH